MPVRVGYLRLCGVVGLALLSGQLQALDRLSFRIVGGDEGIARTVRAASLVHSLQAEGQTDPQDLLGAARADYARILGALYARGYYGPVISITLDGREVAQIPAISVPDAVSAIVITVDPGPAFRFGETKLAPVPPGTTFPDGFRPGAPAESGVVRDAVDDAILAWREVGHAKAAVESEAVTASHPDARLDVNVTLDPGPRLRFGSLAVEGEQRMREARIRRIAGLPQGQTFSDAALRRAETRLRRTGIFSAATLEDSETITAPDLVDITATVVEQKPRRYSFGAEVAGLDGIGLTASWLHRNLLGGGERLLLEGSVTNLGTDLDGVDYGLGVTLDRPATITADTTAGLSLQFQHLDDIDTVSDTVDLGLTLTQILSERLTATAGITLSYQKGQDPAGDFTFRNLSFPLGVTWDRRDDSRNATTGSYLQGTVTPFLGFSSTGSGLRATFDSRIYRGFGERFVLAARVQGGAVLGPDLLDTPRDFLFLSGGGGTVRGQPYRSLGVRVERSGADFLIGGKSLIAGSLELRARVTERIGVVGFVDAATISADGFTDFDTSHAGAGLGLRYDTGLGPIRVDVAAPVSGDTGEGVQIYVGLGQAF